MATTSEARALPFFTDLQGLPLSSGYIYIGQAGLDPIAYPAVVTADVGGTTVVAQPVRTTNGHAAQAGAFVHLFCPIPYSILILDSAQRPVYTSLNETDPVAVAVQGSSVQSAGTLDDLRARSKNSTNQVWVKSYGMYVYNPTDTTSPENIPFLIVGNDGARYNLSSQYVQANYVKTIQNAVPSSTGSWLSFGDFGAGETNLTTNPGATGGGFNLRTVGPSGSPNVGLTKISRTGDIATTGAIESDSNITASGGVVNLTADGTRYLSYNPGGSIYVLSGADLQINGALALTPPKLASNQQIPGIGALALGNSTGPQGVGSFPGTWVSTGSNFNTVWLWVRTL